MHATTAHYRAGSGRAGAHSYTCPAGPGQSALPVTAQGHAADLGAGLLTPATLAVPSRSGLWSPPRLWPSTAPPALGSRRPRWRAGDPARARQPPARRGARPPTPAPHPGRPDPRPRPRPRTVCDCRLWLASMAAVSGTVSSSSTLPAGGFSMKAMPPPPGTRVRTQGADSRRPPPAARRPPPPRPGPLRPAPPLSTRAAPRAATAPSPPGPSAARPRLRRCQQRPAAQPPPAGS